MQAKQHFSSSSGNLYEIVAENGNRLIVELGVQWPKIQKALSHNLRGIEAAFVSHCHNDHAAAAKDATKAGINVYASAGTLDAITLDGHRRAFPVADKTLVRLNSFDVLCFATEHDAPESLGFVIREKTTNEYLLFCTDTKCIKQQFPYPFSIIMLECSYSLDILQYRVDTNDINESLAKRLLTSHLEKQNTIKYLADFCDLSKCRELHLLHLSADNLDKEATCKEIEERFFIKTVIVNGKEAISNVEV